MYLAMVIALMLVFPACGSWERASVTVAYDAGMQSETWRLPELGRKNVESAFKSFSEKNGYQCRPNFKHAHELVCRGPKDMHLEFKPALNKPAFVATFSWMGSLDRTHGDFVRLITAFTTQMSAAAGDKNVRIEE